MLAAMFDTNQDFDWPAEKHKTQYGDVWVQASYSYDKEHGSQIMFQGSKTMSPDDAAAGWRVFACAGEGRKFAKMPEGTPDYVARELAWAVNERKDGQKVPLEHDPMVRYVAEFIQGG